MWVSSTTPDSIDIHQLFSPLLWLILKVSEPFVCLADIRDGSLIVISLLRLLPHAQSIRWALKFLAGCRRPNVRSVI